MYNALQLSSTVEALLKRPLCLSSPREIAVFAEFNHLLNDDSAGSLIRRLGAKDRRKVTHGEHLYILELLNSMFFPGEVDLT